MIFSEADIRKAVKAAQRMIDDALTDPNPGYPNNEKVAALITLDPEAFYQKVLEYARSKQ